MYMTSTSMHYSKVRPLYPKVFMINGPIIWKMRSSHSHLCEAIYVKAARFASDSQCVDLARSIRVDWLTDPPVRPPPGLTMGQSRIAAVILCMAAVALAAEVEAAKPVYRLVAEDVGGEISECKMGPYIRCDKIEVLHENLKSEDEVEFEGLILKKTDAYEDEDMGSALYTFTVSK